MRSEPPSPPACCEWCHQEIKAKPISTTRGGCQLGFRPPREGRPIERPSQRVKTTSTFLSGIRIRTGDPQLGNASERATAAHTSKSFLTYVSPGAQDVACCGAGSGVRGGVVPCANHRDAKVLRSPDDQRGIARPDVPGLARRPTAPCRAFAYLVLGARRRGRVPTGPRPP